MNKKEWQKLNVIKFDLNNFLSMPIEVKDREDVVKYAIINIDKLLEKGSN
jgi:hypothetical protein